MTVCFRQVYIYLYCQCYWAQRELPVLLEKVASCTCALVVV
jgi:hypothetical protein